MNASNPEPESSASQAAPRSPSPGRRGTLALGAVALAAALGGAGLASWRLRQTDEPLSADPLWTQSFERPDGGAPLNLGALRGRPLLVNFWATWCPPCVEELPLLDRFHAQQAASGWQTVALAIDQPSSVRRFLQQRPLGLPVGLAGLGGTELMRELGNENGGLPYSLLIDARARIVARKMGQLREEDLSAWQARVV